MSKQNRTYGAALQDLDSFVTGLREKQAADGLPLGGDQGDKDTTHPSKSVDNQEQAGTEGARSAENESDISKDVPGVNINDVPAAEANKPAAMAGLTTAATTGQDGANETPGAKSDKHDPGTAHPVEMDGTENGQKTAALIHASIETYGVEKTAGELALMVTEELTGAVSTAVPAAVKTAAEAGQAAGEQLSVEINSNMPTILNNLEKLASDHAASLFDYYAGIEAQAEIAPHDPLPQEAAILGLPDGLPDLLHRRIRRGDRRVELHAVNAERHTLPVLVNVGLRVPQLGPRAAVTRQLGTVGVFE